MSTTPAKAWWREIDARCWRSLAAAAAGWMLDAMDVMLYAVALESIGQEFGLDKGQRGAIASAMLIFAAAGGVLSGYLSDRLGRVRLLMFSMLTYSVFTALTATAQNVWQLVLWRTLVGIGMGGEWGAGAVLVAETWPAQHRGKAIGLMQSGWAIGYMLAAVLSGIIQPWLGWRALFVAGLFPALIVYWIRRRVPEPELWVEHRQSAAGRSGDNWKQLFRPPLLRRALLTVVASSALLFSYWGLFTWIPSYLSSSDGGAGLNIVKTSGWIVIIQTGAFCGYSSFGFLADRFGRKLIFGLFAIGAAIIVPIFGIYARTPGMLMLLGPLVGFLGHGYFSVFGAMLAELFPAAVRGTAQGACFNIGRLASAAAPWLIGALAEKRGIGAALGATAVGYVVGAIAIACLPETRGRELEQ